MKLLSLCLLCVGISASAQNPKPFVVPELKEWCGGKGSLEIKNDARIFGEHSINRHDINSIRNIEGVEKAFIADYAEMFKTHLNPVDHAYKADIILKIKPDKELGAEGYTIEIGSKITITAPTTTGLFWGTRTLLQMREQSQKLPRGVIRDWPDYPLRGFMLDCGRKFFPMHFLRDYVKLMAYYKMNAFQIHLNDNGFPQFFEGDWARTQAAFRLESDTFPGLAARDGYYTKDEFRELQRLAEANCVQIIPEIDIPAHSLAFTRYNPELVSPDYAPDHVDLFKPETYDFFDALLKEYIEGADPVFRGRRVHVGTDEYSNKDPRVVEKFRHFTDHYIELVEQYGKQACIWGALTHAKGTTRVKSENVLMWIWHNPFAQPDDMLEQGYRLVSIPDGLLYIVPRAGYYYDYLNTEYLYNNWTPAVIGDKTFAERHPGIEGGMFAVWNDHPGNGVSTKDVHHRVLPAMKALAAKMWTGNSVSVPYDEFSSKAVLLSEAPGVNIAGRLPQKEFIEEILKPGVESDLREVGWDYTVSFRIDGHFEPKGTVLTESTDATFYLSDPISGMIGFAQDGYLNTFDWSVREGETAIVTVRGDSKEVKLFVDGLPIAPRYPVKIYGADPKTAMNYTATLLFPLARTGLFHSAITSFKVSTQ